MWGNKKKTAIEELLDKIYLSFEENPDHWEFVRNEDKSKLSWFRFSKDGPFVVTNLKDEYYINVGGIKRLIISEKQSKTLKTKIHELLAHQALREMMRHE